MGRTPYVRIFIGGTNLYIPNVRIFIGPIRNVRIFMGRAPNVRILMDVHLMSLMYESLWDVRIYGAYN